MKFRLLILCSLLALVAACSTPPTPVPPTSVSLPPAATPDAAATELAITIKIFATLTASAPQSTVTPPPLPDAATQQPPAPTVVAPTLSVQLSPSVTPIPNLPTAVPTRSAVVSAEPTKPPAPVVSAEGLRGKILFKSTRAGGKYPGTFNYFVMDADGSNVTLLSRDAAAALAQEQISNAGYSPDRSFLVVGEQACSGAGRCDLYIAAPELAVTRSQGQWTSGPAFSRADQPVWSPDGNWIAFTWNLEMDRTKNIFKGQPFQKNQNWKRLTDFGGHRDTKSPTYSPDGTLLAFATQDGPFWQIWTLNALAENFTDAAPHSITNTESDNWDPVWIR